MYTVQLIGSISEFRDAMSRELFPVKNEILLVTVIVGGAVPGGGCGHPGLPNIVEG